MLRSGGFCKVAVPLLLVGGTGACAQTYDIVLRNGYVVDPRNDVSGHRDVAIANGRIAAVEPSIDVRQARQVFDIDGLFLTPGLVDIHTHLYSTTGIAGAWAGDSSVRPDSFSFRTGVTTMVDAGSSGWRNFETFREAVIDRVQTRVLALINIAGRGMESQEAEQADFGPAEVARLAEQHADVVVGVKSAHFQSTEWTSVDNAVAAGRTAEIPVMVDFGRFLEGRPFWELVEDHLRPGDLATHCFRAPVPWVDADGKLYAYLDRARARGVKFDVGHGAGSFVFRNAAPAIAQGFYPDSISTDLHGGSMNSAMMDMPTVMSKFLALGMPLDAVVRASTSTPAQLIGRPKLGHLGVGAAADIAVLRLDVGKFRFRDVRGGMVVGNQRLAAEMTLLEGEVVWDRNSRTGTDYRQLPPNYGVTEPEVLLTPPR